MEYPLIKSMIVFSWSPELFELNLHVTCCNLLQQVALAPFFSRNPMASRDVLALTLGAIEPPLVHLG